MSPIKVYRTAAITGSDDSNGNIALYTNHAITGEILKVIFTRGDARAAGSLQIFESGVAPEEIVRLKTTLQTSQSIYPMVFPVDATGGAISGAGGVVVPRVTNAPLLIVGSGLGNAGSSFSGLQIYYR